MTTVNNSTKTGACLECSVKISWRMAFCRRCYNRIPAQQRQARTAEVFEARRLAKAARCVKPGCDTPADGFCAFHANQWGADIATLSDAALSALMVSVAQVRMRIEAQS